MAQSTALRFRNRQQTNSIDSFLDAVGNLGGIAERILVDSIDVTEVSWATEISKRTGDLIDSFSDGESFTVNPAPLGVVESLTVTDGLVIEKSQSKILTDQVPIITDAGFITDKDLLRYRVLSDSFSVNDSFDKSITKTPSVVNYVTLGYFYNQIAVKDFQAFNSIVLNKRTLIDSLLVTDRFQKTITIVLPASTIYDRVKFDDVVLTDAVTAEITKGQAQSTVYSRVRTSNAEVTDDAQATFLGIVVRTLSDSVSVSDFDTAEDRKSRRDALSLADSWSNFATRNRVPTDSITVDDDIIVTRAEIINEVTVSDSITMFDQALPSVDLFVQVSAEIIIGIEVQ